VGRLALPVCVVLLVLGSVRPRARQDPAAFKSGVTLVRIDVTVLDRDGRPVPGLTAADFEVKLNGRVQPVRSVTFLPAAAAIEPMAGAVGPTFDAVTLPAPPPGTPVAPATARGAPRAFVILVDDLSFLPTRGRELFAAAARFVAALPPNDRVGLATTTGVGTINPTTDRAAIRDALTRVVGAYVDPTSNASSGPGSSSPNSQADQPIGIAQALAIERGDAGALEAAIARKCFNGVRQTTAPSTSEVVGNNQCASMVQLDARRTAAAIKQNAERQLQAYQTIIRAMQPAAGVKHLVLLTDGIGLSPDMTALEPVSRAAAEAGVQVSVMVETADASLADEGRRVPGPGQPQETDLGATQRRREDAVLFLNGAKTVADTIGGAIHHVVGSPDPFFGRVQTAASAVYRIAVEPPSGTPTGRDFALSALVKRAGISTLTNRRAVVGAGTVSGAVSGALPVTRSSDAAPAGMSVDERLRHAIATGRPQRGLPVALGRTLRRGSDPATVTLDVAIEIPASATLPLTAVLGIVEPGGSIRSANRTIDLAAEAGAYRIDFSLPLAPGAYKLRFAAADATGTVGAIESAVDAQLATIGPLRASDLLRWTAGADGRPRALMLQELPGGAVTAGATLELYPAAGGPPPADLLVKLGFGSADPATPASLERLVVPEMRDGVLTAEAEFPLDRVTSGSYTMRAVVMSGATVLGTASAIVIKR
jgi:VWFA-related protein